jgi:hypothetical protein
VKRRDRYAPVRESGFHRRGAIGAPPRRQHRSSVHPAYPGQRPSSAVKDHPVRRGAQENGCPSTRGAAGRRSTGSLAGIGTVSLAQPGCAAGLVRYEGPGAEFRQYRQARLCGRFQEGLRTGCWCRANCCGQTGATLCDSWPPPGGATTCPVRCDHKASRPDTATTPGLPLNDLAPRFAPQRHWTPDGGRSRARAKGPVREAPVGIFPPDWNCPASARPRHISFDLGFCLRVELRTFSLHRKRSSDR